MKINLLTCIPNRRDATSFYRSMGPLSELRRANLDIEFLITQEFSWDIFLMSDVFFMQRPFTEKHVKIAEMAKDVGVPIWVDYDDDLFSVPVSNPAYAIYGKKQIQKNIATIIAMADIVTVSTEHLKKRLEIGKPLNSDIRVVPNALNKNFHGEWTSLPSERRKLVMWRGSPTHQKDLQCFLKEIVTLIESDETWKWYFQGDCPWFLAERTGDNARFVESLDPMIYFQTMKELKPSVMMVPLHDCVFNHSKSNIAWLEAAIFGAMTVGPKWDEWERPGCKTYRNAQQFLERFNLIMKGSYDFNLEVKAAREYIDEHLDLREVNKLRIKVIEDLLG